MERKHHPPHYCIDKQWTLVSAATIDHKPLLADTAAKQSVHDILKAKILDFDAGLRAWVILDQHYHLLIRFQDGSHLPRFVAALHGATARALNLAADQPGRRVWDNYWDSGIRSESDLWTRFNYVHHNPIKHGYVDNMADWPWSSYRFHLDRRGRDWMIDVMERYPVVDTLRGDVF
jgi:putative transposase